MINKFFQIAFIIFFFTACKDKKANNDEVLEKVKTYLINDFLKEDIEFMTPDDKKFQMTLIDLNDDGKDEIFIQFVSPYFCGTGGCTFLLLDNQLNHINTFSVTRAPIYVETIKNNWANLYTFNKGKLKILEFKGGKYPSNPSMAKNTNILKPNNDWDIIFEEDLSKQTTYTF
ncbi:hypothetical protein QVZ41_06875 [Wenyingzhuangia sp. chi5]|uniref:Lipoprotein n=1 Tax=Wenyingzhuangia gilva TaxID=3057677 RepID=A0ABT8VRH2_9FLAO|nr:hypothetical protein [Wenyingzhuangia sp. chi5]MDO3694567.1 hypothetical protein [Wenyingzhuangia sp. chi5]